MKDVIRDMGLDDKTLPSRLCLNLISRSKDQLQTPDDFESGARAAGDYRMERVAKAYLEYQKRLKTANALDFDDKMCIRDRTTTVQRKPCRLSGKRSICICRRSVFWTFGM